MVAEQPTLLWGFLALYSNFWKEHRAIGRLDPCFIQRDIPF